MTRSIWHQVLGNCKTEASAKPVPMDSYMAEDLLRWRRQSVYASDDHYVFASETMKGKQPYWPDNLMKRHIQPAAKAIGIHKKIGWHTFRQVKSQLFCRFSFLRVVGSCFWWLSGQLAEGVARSELTTQAATGGISVSVAGSSTMLR